METIKLNDVEYVKKADYEVVLKKQSEDLKDKKAQRFETHQEAIIMRSLVTIFSSQSETISEEDAVQNGAFVFDPANICAVYGKTERAKRVLAHFISSDAERKPVPSWDFIQKEAKASKSSFSTEYLQKIIEFFGTRNDSLAISVIKDHPTRIEDRDFAFILAPRLEMDEEVAS